MALPGKYSSLGTGMVDTGRSLCTANTHHPSYPRPVCTVSPGPSRASEGSPSNANPRPSDSYSSRHGLVAGFRTNRDSGRWSRGRLPGTRALQPGPTKGGSSRAHLQAESSPPEAIEVLRHSSEHKVRQPGVHRKID